MRLGAKGDVEKTSGIDMSDREVCSTRKDNANIKDQVLLERVQLLEMPKRKGKGRLSL